MAFPGHLSKEKLEELLSISERNRWERLKTRQLNSDSISDKKNNSEFLIDGAKLVLFGAESAFIRSIIEMFNTVTTIAHFDNPENMITFCLDHAIQAIILDIDPPTDVHIVMDVFASLKMLLPISKIFVCSSRKKSLEVEHFKIFGATILEKPFLRKQVQLFCNKYLSQ
jgi:hypothetical protein